jgi:hypothetical protein
MRPSTFVVSLATCLSVASAWPGWLPERDSLVVRQDDSEETSVVPSQTPAPESTKADPKASTTAGEDQPQTTEDSLNTAVAPTGTNTRSRTGSRTGTLSGDEDEPSRTQFAAEDPAGSVIMVTPATTTGTPIFKIKDYITFGWSYNSNLQGTPTAIDVILSCSAATETWTLTSNMTFQTSASYVWDSNVQATAVESPLLTEMYTLIIADADTGPSATAEPGYLAVYSGLIFGMYHPARYTPLSEWECGTCNAAAPGLNKQAMRLALGMSAITVLSFTWFVAGFGALL